MAMTNLQREKSSEKTEQTSESESTQTESGMTFGYLGFSSTVTRFTDEREVDIPIFKLAGRERCQRSTTVNARANE
jgi:hypothetical protein